MKSQHKHREQFHSRFWRKHMLDVYQNAGNTISTHYCPFQIKTRWEHSNIKFRAHSKEGRRPMHEIIQMHKISIQSHAAWSGWSKRRKKCFFPLSQSHFQEITRWQHSVRNRFRRGRICMQHESKTHMVKQRPIFWSGIMHSYKYIYSQENPIIIYMIKHKTK